MNDNRCREPTGFSKRFLDLVVRCISADTENFVEVNFAGCHYPTLLGPRGGRTTGSAGQVVSKYSRRMVDGGRWTVGGYSDETSLQR